MALNKAHALRLNTKICPVFTANTKEAALGCKTGLVLTVKTYGFRTIRNSSPDSPDGDLWGVRARFYYENIWLLHNMEFVTGFTGWGFWGVWARLNCENRWFSDNLEHAPGIPGSGVIPGRQVWSDHSWLFFIGVVCHRCCKNRF